MLYYLFEFIKALICHPLTIVARTKRLYKIWRMDKQSKMINEVMYINDINHMCNVPHYASLQCEYAQCSSNHLGRIVEYLDGAVYCIDVAVYALNSAPISRALCRAHKRGVAVRIISEKCYTRNISDMADALVLTDISVVIPRTRSDRMMHHKICIIDGYRRSRELRKPNDQRKVRAILMTGSFNWIAFQHSYDDLLITSNVTLILKVEQEFFRIWKEIQQNNI